MKQRLITFLASVAYTGYSPIASGTAGSLAAFLFFWIVPHNPFFFSVLLITGTILSILIADSAEKIWQKKDDGRIVIDEFIGSGFALFLAPKTILWYASAFILFRLFDVIKPFGIHASQNLKGGLGIVIDDVLAGILAALVLHLVIWII